MPVIAPARGGLRSSMTALILCLCGCDSDPDGQTGDPDVSDTTVEEVTEEVAEEVTEEVTDDLDGRDGADLDSLGVCPVVDYVACGGDLVGAWEFLALCADDPVAAAEACDRPFGDQAECIGSPNQAICESTETGLFTFHEDGTVDFELDAVLEVTWIYSDACLAAVAQGEDPSQRCASLVVEGVACEYDTTCVCVRDPLPTSDSGTAGYSVDDEGLLTIGEDPPASYCVSGDRLVLDFYLFHPASWRYWVLQRAE